MKLTPFVLLLDKTNTDLSKFQFEFTHLTATEFKSGIIEVFTKWCVHPEHLHLFEVASEVGSGADEGRVSTTDETLTEDTKNSIFSFMKLKFEDAQYNQPVEAPGLDPLSSTAKIVIALEQEGTELKYVPIFTKIHRFSCSVYFTTKDWNEYDEPFFDKVFED